jgi:hypothetical protein
MEEPEDRLLTVAEVAKHFRVAATWSESAVPLRSPRKPALREREETP